MSKNFHQRGDTLDYTPSAAVVSGDVVVIGKRVGIAVSDIAANVLGALDVEGVWQLACTSTSTFAMGDLVYWDASAKKATSTATSNTAMGYAAAPVANGDTSMYVKING